MIGEASMNEEIDRNLEFRVRMLEQWCSTFEQQIRDSALILREADAAVDRISIVIDKIRKHDEH